MTQSFFGGDSTMSHFSSSPIYRLAGEETRDAQERRISQYKALKAVGWKERYFRFKTKDAAAKKKAEAACREDADVWEKKVNFALEVCEGCFL